MNSLFTEYGKKARLAPAILCLIPFLVIKHYAVDPQLSTAWWNNISALVIEDLSIGVVLIYLLSQINRVVSKTLFEEKKAFPTDQMLLPSNKDLSDELKSQVISKVQRDFNLTVPNSQDEESDLNRTKIRIREIVSQIVNRVGNGRLVLQFNIEYGFARNLIGGSVIASLVCITGVVLFGHFIKNDTAKMACVGLGFFYLIPILFSKISLRHYSKEYASILFREYVDSK